MAVHEASQFWSFIPWWKGRRRRHYAAMTVLFACQKISEFYLRYQTALVFYLPSQNIIKVLFALQKYQWSSICHTKTPESSSWH
jgi:hypothetical protein